jgi:HEAT repeat protein
MTSTKIDDLFAQTLAGDYDADASLEAVNALQNMGNREVFDRAALWCRSTDPLERARGADILAQLGRTAEHPDTIYPDESFAAVSTMIQGETEPLPLSSAIHAAGHIGNPLALPLITKHRAHADPEVRLAVAFSLGQFPGDPSAAEALLTLTCDADDDVRDWATFGIGALGKLDSPEIRDALICRLKDSWDDVRQEAMVGLARLKDRRVIAELLSVLEQPEVPDLAIEAASEMLEEQDAVSDWKGKDYADALRERFGL